MYPEPSWALLPSVCKGRSPLLPVWTPLLYRQVIRARVGLSAGLGEAGREVGPQGADGELGEPDRQPAARLPKVPVQRVGQKEIGSGQLDRAHGTGQSKRVLGGLSVGAGESSQAPGILSLEERKC